MNEKQTSHEPFTQSIINCLKMTTGLIRRQSNNYAPVSKLLQLRVHSSNKYDQKPTNLYSFFSVLMHVFG